MKHNDEKKNEGGGCMEKVWKHKSLLIFVSTCGAITRVDTVVCYSVHSGIFLFLQQLLPNKGSMSASCSDW